jgi:hypothetical protein
MTPIGIMNACDPPQAALDAIDVDRIRDVTGRPKNYALEVGAAIAAGVAEGLKPGATVEGIIEGGPGATVCRTTAGDRNGAGLGTGSRRLAGAAAKVCRLLQRPANLERG